MSSQLLIMILSLGMLSNATYAQSVTILSSKKDTFVNSDCETNQSCKLKKAFLTEENYRVQVGKSDYNLGTRMVFAYQTLDVKSLEDFGAAQFIKGCQFSSYLNKDKKVVKVMNVDRPLYGATVPYRHPEYVIDNFTRDPIEWGEKTNPNTRHFFYRWLEKATDSFFGNNKYFGSKEPKSPMLFVRDRPNTAFYTTEYKEAKNISLEFKTCIYKTIDVPTDVEVNKLDFAQPLKCFSWRSSFVYNFQSGRFDSPTEIDPFCMSSAYEEVQK